MIGINEIQRMRYDTKALDSIPILQVAKDLGINLTRNNMALCIAHNERTPSMGLHLRTNRWKCFSCGKGGGVISLVMTKCQCNFIEACEWLAGRYNIGVDYTQQRKKYLQPISERNISSIIDASSNLGQSKKNSLRKPDKELMEWLVSEGKLSRQAEDFLYGERRFSKEVIEQQKIFSISNPSLLKERLLSKFGIEKCVKAGIFNVKDNMPYCTFFKPCIVFPYYDINGNIVNLQARTFVKGKKGRYFFLAGIPIRHYNMQIINSLKYDDLLYIAEGVTDCLALLSEGKNAIAIPGAYNICEEDIAPLEKPILLMYPDEDSAGNGLYARLSTKLSQPINRQSLPDGIKDYCDYYVSKFGHHDS